MKIKAISASIENFACDLLVVNEFEGVKSPGGATGAIDRALKGMITHLSQSGEITGRIGTATLIHTHGKIPAERVLVVGLGKREKFDYDEVRKASAAVVAVAKKVKAAKIASIVHGAGIGGLDAQVAAQATVEGFMLKNYKFAGYALKKDEPDFEIKEFILVDHSSAKIKSIEKAVHQTEIIINAVNIARSFVSAPSNEITPSFLANYAQKICKTNHMTCKVLGLNEIKLQGMGALYAVAKGSKEPAKLIVMKYHGAKSKETIGLVGKGITFDSGGISIKPSNKMWEMRDDMAGAAAVIEIMQAAAQLKIKKNLIAVVPCSENMPDGGSFKPGDVIKALSGKTIEVISTDAEGRMVLADALSYAQKLGADKIIDIATLTGACRMTFGDVASGVMTNNQEMLDSIIESSKETGEKMWQLPLYAEYEEYSKSEIADVKNSTETGKASTSTAGLFLKEFVDDIPWVHIDIAGTVNLDKERGYYSAGSTGVPVRTIINWLLK